MSSHKNAEAEHSSAVVETFTNIIHSFPMSVHCIRALTMIQEIVRRLNPYIANCHNLSVWWRESRRWKGQMSVKGMTQETKDPSQI